MKLPAFSPDAADGAMIAVVLMWAANNIFIKTTVDELPPLPYVVGRFVIVILLVWAWIGWRRTPVAIWPRDLPLLLLAGVSGFGLYNALFTVGMERTSAFSAALLMSLSPVFTLLLARLMGIERPTGAQWLAVALAAAGVAVFVADKLRGETLGGSIAGDALCLVASLSFAVYSLAARPLTTRYGALVTTAWAVVVGLVAIGPWGFPAAASEPWRQLSLPVWGSLLYSAAVSMLIGYSLWSWAIARGGVARTVPYLFLVPVLTGMISALALGETFTPLKIGGALMVLIGTALVRMLGRVTVALEARMEASPGAAPVTGAPSGS